MQCSLTQHPLAFPRCLEFCLHSYSELANYGTGIRPQVLPCISFLQTFCFRIKDLKDYSGTEHSQRTAEIYWHHYRGIITSCKHDLCFTPPYVKAVKGAAETFRCSAAKQLCSSSLQFGVLQEGLCCCSQELHPLQTQ